MNDRELALEILKVYQPELRGNARTVYMSTYHNILEDIREYKSETTLGKIEELIYEYHNRHDYCEFYKSELINNIEKLIKGE